MKYELKNLLNQINVNFNEFYTKIKRLKTKSNLQDIECRLAKSQRLIDDILTWQNRIALVESLDYLYTEIKGVTTLLNCLQGEEYRSVFYNEIHNIAYKICWYIHESTKSAMRIVLGFVKDDFKFTLEEEFDYSACYIQTIKDNVISELYINQHLERNQIPYGITISKDDFKLTASGLKRNYALQFTDYYLFSIKGGFQVYNKRISKHQDVFFETNPSAYDILFKNRYDKKIESNSIEKQVRKKEIENKAIKKVNFYINKYDIYYKNIINKELLKAELKISLELIIESFGEENIEQYFDVQEFFLKCSNKEKACEYVKQNATYDNLLFNKPNIVSFGLSKAEIENILRNILDDFLDNYAGEFIFDEIYGKDDVDVEKELQHIFSLTYLSAEENSLEKKQITITKDYSYELIFEMFKDNISKIKSKAYFVKKLRQYLKNIQFNNKKAYLNKINEFINKYISYEERFLYLMDKYNTIEVTIDLTKEKEERFKNNKTSDIQLNEVEKEEYENVYLKTYPLFESIIYLKDGKGIKPTFINFPRYLEWAKELLTWIEDNNVIKIGSKGQTQISYKAIKQIPKRLQNYFNFKEEEDYIAPIENKIVKEIELTIPEYAKTTKSESDVDIILENEFDNYVDVTKNKDGITWTTKRQITQLFLFRILYKFINQYYEKFKDKNTVSFGYFSSDGWDSVVNCKANDLITLYDKLLTKQMQYIKPVEITLSVIKNKCSIEVALSNSKKSLRYIGSYEYNNGFLKNLEI